MQVLMSGAGLMRTVFYPDIYARHDLIIESACLWLEDVNIIQMNVKCRDFGLADVMYVPALERFAANLPMVHGFRMRDNPSYPLLGQWHASALSMDREK